MLWDGNRQLQEYTHHHIFTTIYDQDSFEPVSRVVQSRDKDCDDLKLYHYHNNHLGTPQELTNEQGEMVWLNYEFAWGGTYQNYYKEQSINGIIIDKDELQPLKFQGQYYDPETSLHYNRFRYYDSDVGMFIQRDPIGLLGGLNTFQYAPNPIGWIDPLGLAVVDAVFEMRGKKFSGVNPLDRNPRISEPIEGLSNVNNNKYKMHAEIDAMTKAFDSGLRGGKATLIVQGKNICGYCKGDIKKMALKLDLEELIVIDADKKVYTFTTDELKPVKKGGKGWKSQCNDCICP